jgi:hypothetical protein
MRIATALGLVGAVAAFWVAFSRAESAARTRRLAWDIALVLVAAGFAALFLWQNGFIGNSDIQPYPY